MQKWIDSLKGVGELICLQIAVFILLIINITATANHGAPAWIPILFLLIVIGALVRLFREQNQRIQKIEEELAQLKRSQDH